jgi:hypothetical protein
MQFNGSSGSSVKKPHIPAIRAILRDYPNGRTAKQIHAMLPYIYNIKTIKSGLRKMPDAYIDRWILEPGSRGQYQAIYMVVVPPLDCPHPKDRFPEVCKTRWVDRSMIA